MAESAEVGAMIAANRERYMQLKAAAQGGKLPLPPPTARDAAPLDASRLLHREVIPGGWYWTTRLARGQVLRLLNAQATPGVSFFAWNADDTSERYNAGDTVKVQWTAALAKGRVLFSDMGRVLASIVEDSCAAHDTLLGGSTAASNREKYGVELLRNTRDNLVLAAGKHGLTRRDLAPCITFFAPVATDGEGRFHWRDGAVQPGDFVDLRAEMNLLVAVSNCPHPLAPGAYAPQPIEAIVSRGVPIAAGDLCRTATAEARRGFDNTDPLFAHAAEL
ncbi:urea amidolyase associated protein UAAP1 [Solimonas soli]|uniref:urea amidolyase associated protein UAAP1 n=1 Tax=Solimonas soli TaxID=413479 RepID=UPI000687F048|nr:urea amidolyase associated protein UAAP1 [Solimonas soli]